MAEITAIEWADTTLGLWVGCTQISPACDHCYAMRFAVRLQVPWNAPPRRAADSAWDKIPGYQRSAARFRKIHGRERRVFVNHMSDIADNQADQAWRDQAFNAFEAAPDVVWMLVTKRPQMLRRQVPPRWMRAGGWPKNVWVIVTTENQEEYDRRVLDLMHLPAPVRGLSMEPLLEAIDPWAFKMSANDIAREIKMRFKGKPMPLHIRRPEWIIIGGESGRGARSIPRAADANLVHAARGNKIAVFYKQRSAADYPDTFKQFDTFPASLQIREFPTHA